MKNVVLSLLVIIVSLTGCTSNNSAGKPLSEITFSHMRPMPLQVSNVVKRDGVGQKRNITTDFSVPVDAMVDSYIESRLRAMGGDETLFVELEELSVTHNVKDSTNKVAGFMGVAKIESYNIVTGFNLVLENQSNGAIRGKRFTVRRTINISEHSSVAEREMHQQKAIEEMFRDIDQSMMEILKNEFMI